MARMGEAGDVPGGTCFGRHLFRAAPGWAAPGWGALARGLATVAALLTGLVPAANAFHEGGVGSCDGCHDLHPEAGSTESMLRGSDTSSTCLRCHAEIGADYNVRSIDGSSFTAGGDFYWLGKSFTWLEDGQVQTNPADSHGHNVVAASFGLRQDGRVAAAPGGNYPATSLSCVSCHDPHGQPTREGNGEASISVSGSYQADAREYATRGNYRLLGGRGYSTSGFEFSNDAPVARASTDWRETDGNHVDYGSGMSEWCVNCHGSMLHGSAGQHPAGGTTVFSDWTADTYGAYVRTGDLSGSAGSSYLALVPFERGVSDPDLLDPASSAGPEPGLSNVMCLTCHRAHASAFPSIGRWDMSVSFLATSHPQTGDGGADGADAWNSYYGRDVLSEFGPYQRSLCNKCHAKD